uniref:Uncharacterized protein n=1 Tax=Rhizophora mucronata TaxID=61149 RepID=A0A2P2MAP6_RHIMU
MGKRRLKWLGNFMRKLGNKRLNPNSTTKASSRVKG